MPLGKQLIRFCSGVWWLSEVGEALPSLRSRDRPAGAQRGWEGETGGLQALPQHL